ncbi:acyl dehydratase [Antricoccus suffuscus]|uniref:Acyl dehydratase n=1 Tax=Antricoccus suffuscus TaxID=1629062 RepID=A0A2T0ZS10_9ACTN|nr:MaoC family dehydratase [Antricoccus suffuscus]PRZ39140.1 acyl dehydratase [Antricoccus suffuscus]
MSVAIPAYADIEVGTELPETTIQVTRADLVRYAGASGDFNIIHWNDRTATAVGLPGVIAHGMLTMAKAANAVTAWVGDPGRVLEYAVRFSRPVPVPDDDTGATLVITGRVSQKLEDNQARVDLVVKCDGAKVLSLARAVVRLA